MQKSLKLNMNKHEMTITEASPRKLVIIFLKFSIIKKYFFKTGGYNF